MKKIILFISLFSICFMNVQSIKANEPITFFGVDYSLVKVFGAEEPPREFINAFNAINSLFIIESRKYNPEKAFKTNDITFSLGMTYDLIEKIDMKDLKIDSNNYGLTKEKIEERVRTYDTGDESGTGAIMIAELLDRGKPEGLYHAVVFDIETKEIISDKIVSGKAGGFGLRNFWARSVLESFNKMAKSKK